MSWVFGEEPDDMKRGLSMPALLVEMVRDYSSMENKKSGAARALLEKIRIAGHTANFFDEGEGMWQLHDAAESFAGNDDSIGGRLNFMWHGIGNWCA